MLYFLVLSSPNFPPYNPTSQSPHDGDGLSYAPGSRTRTWSLPTPVSPPVLLCSSSTATNALPSPSEDGEVAEQSLQPENHERDPSPSDQLVAWPSSIDQLIESRGAPIDQGGSGRLYDPLCVMPPLSMGFCADRGA